MRLRRETVVWAILLFATIISWLAGHEVGSVAAMPIVFILAFIKVYIIMVEFMELRGALIYARFAAGVWVIAMMVVLSCFFVSAKRDASIGPMGSHQGPVEIPTGSGR